MRASGAQARADEPAVCPKGACDGSGWILGPEDIARPCECRERQIAKARSSGVSSVIPARYRGVSFDRPPVTQINPTIVGQVRDFCDDLDDNLRAGRGLWFFGNSGTGKTTLAMLVSKLVLEHGGTAAIYSLPQLLSRIRQTFDYAPGEESYLDLFAQLTSVDLLHLDDLGAENRTEWVLEQLYALINERYESEKSLVVTTNLTAEELEEQIGERVVSRLVEMCGDPLPLYGDDRRLKVAPPPPDSAS